MTSLRVTSLLASAVLLAPVSYAVAPASAAAPDVGQVEAAHALDLGPRLGLGIDSDGDGLPDDGDGCPTVASSNPTGCPSAWRKVSLTWLAGERRLQAQVSSPVSACASRARIKLWLDRTDRADKLLSSNASFNGRRTFKAPGGARYYVTVSPSYSTGVAECGKATSRKVRVPR